MKGGNGLDGIWREAMTDLRNITGSFFTHCLVQLKHSQPSTSTSSNIVISWGTTNSCSLRTCMVLLLSGSLIL